MQHRFNHDSIYKFQKENNLTTKDTKLLFEAFRRMEFLGSGKRDENDNMLGLGSPSQYKSQYFTATFGEIPRVNNWYRLTDPGKEMIRKIKKQFTVPPSFKNRNAINLFLFTF